MNDAQEAIYAIEDGARFPELVESLKVSPESVPFVLARPSRRRSAALGSDLISAMGKTLGSVDPTRAANAAFAYAAAWMAAESVDAVVIGSAQDLRPSDMVRVIHLGSLIGFTPFFLFDQIVPDKIADLLSDWEAIHVDSLALRTRLKKLGRPIPVPEQDDDAPVAHLAPYEFPAFYDEARNRLSKRDFAKVDALYRTGFDAAQTLETESLGEDDVASSMHDQIKGLAGKTEVLSVVRGMQAGLFKRRVLLRVDVARLLSTDYASGLELSDKQWRALGSYAQPRNAAIGTLAALGLSAAEIAALPATAVALDGRSIKLDGEDRSVPPAARRYLIAQHTFRLIAAVEEGEPFVSGTLRHGKISRLGVTRTLTSITGATGIVFRRQHERRANDQDWRRRWGVAIIHL